MSNEKKQYRYEKECKYAARPAWSLSPSFDARLRSVQGCWPQTYSLPEDRTPRIVRARSSTTRRRVTPGQSLKRSATNDPASVSCVPPQCSEQKITKECEITRTRCHRPLIYALLVQRRARKQLAESVGTKTER